MSDYKVSLGAEVRTKDIDTAISNYKKPIELRVQPNMKSFETALQGYKPVLNVNTKLSTNGITEAIRKYKAKKDIKVGADLDTTGIDTQIESYDAKPLKVKVDLNWAGVKGQIAKPNVDLGKLNIDVELNDDAIVAAINRYADPNNKKVKTIPIKIRPDFSELNWNEVETLLGTYEARTPLKVNVQLLKGTINDQIKQYNQTALTDEGRTIQLRARLTDNAVADAISNYKVGNAEKLKIPVDLTFKSDTEFDTELKRKIKTFEGTPVDIPVRLKPAAKGFTNQISKLPVYIDAVLKNADDINNAITAYSNNPVPVAARLIRGKNFDSEITKTPIKVQAELAPDALNSAISNPPKALSKLPIGVKLAASDVGDINKQVKQLEPFVTEKIGVGIKLDADTINADIALFKPTATLGIQPDLIIENVDEQIAAYTPKVPVKVKLQIEDSDIDEKAGKPSSQEPITVNIKLDREKINEQIREFKTQTKITVGVKLDFASHKDGQKGIPQQIKDYKTKAKIKVGVQLDTDSIRQAAEQVNVDTPIKLPVELDNSNVQSQIDSIRQQLEKLGNIKIDLVGVENDSKNNVSGVDDTTGITHRGIPASNVAQSFREANIEINAANNATKNLATALKEIGFDKSVIQSMTSEFEKLGVTVTNVTSKLNGDGSVKLTVKGLDEYKDAVTLVKNVGADGKSGAWSETISRDVNQITENFNRLKSLAKDIGNLKLDIFETNDPNEIRRLTAELNALQKEYSELYTSTQGGLKPNQLSQLDNIIKNADASLDLKNKLEKEIKIKLFNSDLGLSQFDNEIGDVVSKFSSLRNKDIPQLNSAMNELSAAFDRVKKASKDGNQEELIRANREYEAALKAVKAQLDIKARAEQKAAESKKLADDIAEFQSKINAWQTKNSAAAKQFGAKLEDLKRQAKNCDRTTLNHLESEFKQVDKAAEAAGKKTQSFTDRLKTQFQRYGAYLSVASIIMYGTQALRDMFQQVKAIDSAMTELKKVTDETDSSYNRFLSNAASRAKELGTTVDGLVASTADFARLGYGFEDAQELAEVANIYAVVGDEIEGVEDATQSLISTLAAFKDEMNGMDNGDFAISIVDKMNEVANNYAISSGGLGQALQRSASSMAAANNSLDETIAMITAANEIAQNPEKVGNAIKTKFLYNCLNVQKCA